MKKIKLEPQEKIEMIEWIEALESGRYEQGDFYLCRDDKYCCLGVKAHLDGALVEPENPRKYGMQVKDTGWDTAHTPISERLFNNQGLPKHQTVRKKFQKYLPRYVEGYCSLSNLNDNAELSFKEIAQLLRDCYEVEENGN